MRNRHIFKGVVILSCPKESCGYKSVRTVKVEYVTNQRGDVIEHTIRS